MSTFAPAATALISTPEIIVSDEIQDIYIPEPIKSPQALRLLDLGLTSKARAYEDCYEFVFVYRCKNNHLWPVALTCHERYCDKGCAEHIAQALVEKYDKVDIGNGDFLFIEISQFADLDRDFVASFNKFIGRGFKQLEKTATAPLGTVWNTNASPRRLTAQLLLWGDDIKSFERYRAAWPEAIVKVSVRPAHQFHFALHQVFAPDLPKDPIIRADYEFLFHGIRKVHTMGNLHSHIPAAADKVSQEESQTCNEEGEELFPQVPTTGDNSARAPSMCCPKCHEPAIAVTGKKKSADFRDPKLGFNWYAPYMAR